MSSRLRRAGPLLAAVVAAAVLAGCTEVPLRSSPDTVESIGVGQQPVTAGGPQSGAPPRQIVSDFLAANTSDPVKHSVAREYLTPAARNRWSDTTVTIIADESVGIYTAADGTVTVTGRKVGSLDSHGVYTPSLDGTGHGGAPVPFTFGIDVVNGQNRISSLGAGLLLTEAQFRTYYPQRTLYFFDTAERYLVPDLRYSPLTDANEISDWMLDQIVQGPSQSLAGVVNTDPLAAQSQRISVKITAAATTVQIPGARQLSPDVRDRLAAQVSVTLGRAVAVGDITLTDGERPVTVPAVGGTVFSAADFAGALGPPLPAQRVYYLRDGRVRTENGRALPGPLGDGSTLFDSIALTQPGTGGDLLVAGVQGPAGGTQRLVIGTQDDGVRSTLLPPGRLTRPAWAPGRSEVWIGDGSKLYRVTVAGRTTRVIQVPVPPVAGGGRLVAVRLSPEGSRVALVVQGVSNRPQLYVAGIARTARTVQVETPTLISPSGAVVEDVAWIDSFKVYAIGYLAGSQDAQVYRTNVDGASWSNLGVSTLPDPPDSITMVQDAQSAWVSAAGFVWEQNYGNWVSPVTTNGQTPGDDPIYLS